MIICVIIVWVLHDKGVENTLIENIKNIMDGFGVLLEKALDVLKVPKSDYAKYENLLK